MAGAVSGRDRYRDAYPHSAVLLRTVTGGAYRVMQRRFDQGDGNVIVAIRRSPVTPHPEALSQADISRNVKAMAR